MYKPEMFYQHSIFSEIDSKDDELICCDKMTNTHFDENDIEKAHDSYEPKKTKEQKCKICGITLSSPSSYYVHMKKHSNNKPHKCSYCDASFCRKPYLEVHLRSHTGEKPFKCNICQRSFTQKSSLNTHKRGHTGLLPFACEICFKKFPIKNYLEAHRWSHAALYGVACNVCELKFHNKNTYMIHIQTHNKKGFKCDDCPKVFAKESFLVRHRTRVHKILLEDPF